MIFVWLILVRVNYGSDGCGVGSTLVDYVLRTAGTYL